MNVVSRSVGSNFKIECVRILVSFHLQNSLKVLHFAFSTYVTSLFPYGIGINSFLPPKFYPHSQKNQIPNRYISHQSEDGAKRQKLSDSGAALAANVPQLGGIRRSTRHRKLRGEKALIVSANQTLKELKIQVGAGDQRPRTGAGKTRFFLCLTVQIMHAFSVAPFDQNLSIDGKGLTDDSATLGSLGVVPESIICLKVAAAKLEAARGWGETRALNCLPCLCCPAGGRAGVGLRRHGRRLPR